MRLRSRAKKILVVDDDATFCSIMEEILVRSGYNVLIAHSTRQAIRTLERNTPDLILTDIMMPETDGLSLLRQVRARPAWSSIPAIAVSARVLETDQDAARNAGANAFITKPFSARRLERAIKRYLPSTN